MSLTLFDVVWQRLIWFAVSLFANVTMCPLTLRGARWRLQVRCVDKSTGDMMVRYTMAAQSALELLRQLLFTCRTASSGDFEEVAGGYHAGDLRPCLA